VGPAPNKGTVEGHLRLSTLEYDIKNTERIMEQLRNQLPKKNL
jgi:hypothetical protein